MLSCSPTITTLIYSHRQFEPFTASPTRSLRSHVIRVSSDRENAREVNGESIFLRTHNAKSTSTLLRHLSPIDQLPEQKCEVDTLFVEDDKDKMLEFSLDKRTPQFPGSIYLDSSISQVQRVLNSGETSSEFQGVDIDNGMLMRALEIRRKVTVEVFKDCMKKGKFGITYSENMVSQIPEFIDFVMIKAVSLKNSAEFSRSSFNFRVQVFIDQSGVVPLIRWLKHNSLSYPQIGKLIVRSGGIIGTIRQFVEWLKSIHVKGRYIGVALTRVEGNVLERSIEDLNEIVEYLEENGVRSDWMGYVISRCPEILTFSMKELQNRTEFYLKMGMDKNDFGTMVYDCPKVLGYLTMDEMNRKVMYLKEFGLSDEDMGRLLAHKPQLMACSIEERWMPLVKYFYYLGISKDGMRRILTHKPIIFCIDLENTIVPKVQFLRDIGIAEDALGGVLVKCPSVMTYSLYKKIRPLVIFLIARAGVSQDDVGKVIALGPELLGCSIAHKLDPNVKYFLSLGITLPVLGKMISDFPLLLTYNIDILRPKYRYLRRVMVRPLQDLIEFPRFFSYSLEERIIPRHKIMLENRVNFKLRYMLKSTDEDFDARVKEAVDRRRRFESGLAEQPLSNSEDEEDR